MALWKVNTIPTGAAWALTVYSNETLSETIKDAPHEMSDMQKTGRYHGY